MEIIVKSKKYGNKICIIDDSDFEAVKSMSLSVKPSDGGVFYIRAGNVGLHRILLNAPKGVQVDHINLNPLDNRRANLRLATQEQNNFNRKISIRNKSGFKGVYWCKGKSCWCARIQIRGRAIFGGYYKCKIDAAHKYNELAKIHFGEFASFNSFTVSDIKNRLNEKRPPCGIRRDSKSGIKGVEKVRDDFFNVHISIGKKKKHIGCFRTAKEAAMAYNDAAIKQFGSGVFLNDISLL